MLKRNEVRLQNLMDSADFCVYVINVADYRIIFANKACNFGPLDGFSTCYKCTHNSPVPCAGPHVCPLKEILNTRRPVTTTHTHYDRLAHRTLLEIHAEPVKNSAGDVVMMIEYGFDLSGGKTAPAEAKVKALVAEMRGLLQLDLAK